MSDIILTLIEVSMLGNESSPSVGCLTSSSFRISSASSWVRIWVSPGRQDYLFSTPKRGRANSKRVHSMKARKQVTAQVWLAYLT